MLPIYYDPLVIMVKIVHREVYRILVDCGRSYDLLYLSTLLDMEIYHKEITQEQKLLVGFNVNMTMSVGIVRFSIFLE